MTKLVFATNNQHKLIEIQKKVDSNIKLLSLIDIGFDGNIPETQNTIQGNALQKARYIYDQYHINCFADDTGLEVEALNGAPGVFSARYAGENASYDDNNNRLLHELQEQENRNAMFITCIALIEDGKERFFEGCIKGIITSQPKGENGFGYDPIFQPMHYKLTFAEMSLEQKNKISHRAKATSLLLNYLKEKYS